ncbi:hypothetical protein [Candidatus Palauibacter sp.]|uniref:hypothetical protein n=1 Tax=Candidatus Palauibacter sp. TaxID=3101350 RepID=UPI003B51B3E8
MKTEWLDAIFYCLCLHHPRPVHYTDIAEWIDRKRLRPPIAHPEATVNHRLRDSMRDDPYSPFRDFGDGVYGLSDVGNELCAEDREIILKRIRGINRYHDRLAAARKRSRDAGSEYEGQ